MRGYWRLQNHPFLVPLAAFTFFAFLANAVPISKAYAAEPELTSEVSVPERKPELRRLRLKHRWTGEQLDIVYKIGGAYQPEAMAEINRFMRDWRCDKSTRMDPNLIDRLYELQQAVGTLRTIRVISAYRSEGHNASLLLAGHTVDPNSHHMFGQAIDIYVPGVSMARLKQIAEGHESGGTGYYPFSGPRFAHLDTGPVRRWTEMDPAERRKLDLPKRARKRLDLNCALTMAEALRNVPVSDAIASLPAGAATPDERNVHQVSLALPPPETANAGQGSQHSHEHAGQSSLAKERPCELANPPGALAIIAPTVENGAIMR
jgi:uncharacterized protein YcbK (DUF882 family)